MEFQLDHKLILHGSMLFHMGLQKLFLDLISFMTFFLNPSNFLRIREVLLWVDKRYNHPPIYVTENGCDVPNESQLPLDQALNDTFRVQFYNDYITEMGKAIDRGVDVKAYFAWSL